jgi:O-antigen/teichoic acid export membrane protein
VTARGDGITGAAWAALAGWLVATPVLVVALARLGAAGRPAWHRSYVRAAVRLGVPLLVAQLLMIAATRVDLVVVHALADAEVAGHYSVALTLGALNTFAALALASAAFPRLAALPEAEVAPYVGRTVRMAALLAVLVGVVLAPLLPWFAVAAFGPGFRPSAGPAMVLLVWGVLWSVQWTLCRAAAARGQGHVLVRSFGGALVVMIVLDVVLVPIWGAMGAAFGAIASGLAGTTVAMRSLRCEPPVRWGVVVPRPADGRDLVHTTAGMLGSVRRRP